MLKVDSRKAGTEKIRVMQINQINNSDKSEFIFENILVFFT